MKKAILGIPLILMVAFSGCDKQTKWQGNIEIVQGVTIIQNPKVPLYGDDACSIVEEFTIGAADGPEEYMLTTIMDMDIDDAGNIYVADMKGNHIRVFDNQGKYTRTIGGGRGQGPGEFMMLRGIQLTYDQKLRALDRMTGSLSDFTLDGSFIGSKLIKGVTGTILSICFDSRDRSYIESVRGGEDGQIVVELNVCDSDFNLLTKVASKAVLQGPVQSFLHWRLTTNEYIVYGDNENYEIDILDSDLKLIRRVEKEYDPIVVRKEEVENRLGRSLRPSDDLPKYYPAYSYISVDDEGRIFVQTWETTETGGYYYDVFDLEGKYITRFVFKYQIKPIWKNGRVYIKESDEDGLPLVKCYQVTWKIHRSAISDDVSAAYRINCR